MERFREEYGTPMKLLLSKALSTFRGAINSGIDKEEIEQIAWEGVMRAAYKYDPTLPNPAFPGQPIAFVTYAMNWIRAFVSRACFDASKRRLKTSSGKTVSGNAAVGKGDLRNGWSMIADPRPSEHESSENGTLIREKVASVLKQLTPRRRQIIELRWGLDGNGERTLDECGQLLGVTRERVRQIEKQAMERIAVPLQLTCGDLLE